MKTLEIKMFRTWTRKRYHTRYIPSKHRRAVGKKRANIKKGESACIRVRLTNKGVPLETKWATITEWERERENYSLGNELWAAGDALVLGAFLSPRWLMVAKVSQRGISYIHIHETPVCMRTRGAKVCKGVAVSGLSAHLGNTGCFGRLSLRTRIFTACCLTTAVEPELSTCGARSPRLSGRTTPTKLSRRKRHFFPRINNTTKRVKTIVVLKKGTIIEQ